jgi:hypothetical protein
VSALNNYEERTNAKLIDGGEEPGRCGRERRIDGGDRAGAGADGDSQRYAAGRNRLAARAPYQESAPGAAWRVER